MICANDSAYLRICIGFIKNILRNKEKYTRILINMDRRMHMILKTERLLLRPWTKADEERLYELASEQHVGPPCGWEPHKSIAESRAVLRDILMNDFTYALVIRETKELIGNISLMPYSESRFAQNERQAEIGFWLGFPYWKQGYMTEACQHMVVYAFEQQGLEKIWCAHEANNLASKRVQEKCGFVFHHEETYHDKGKDSQVCMIVNCIKKQ